jgi:hypothetical protein
MDIKDIEFNYTKYYKSINFERSGLFDCIKKNFKSNNVVYIGSSIHITPSFYFQNVTYIDNSGLSRSFFHTPGNVAAYISSFKKYKSNPHVTYNNVDYQNYKLNSQCNYDIALCIYSPNSLATAIHCIKKKGIIIYLPLPSDTSFLKYQHMLQLTGVLQYKRNKYVLDKKRVQEKYVSHSGYNYLADNHFVEKNTYAVYMLKSP